MAKRQKRAAGDIVKIELGDQAHSYARVLNEATFAFYGWQGPECLEIEKIISLPILFRLAVMDFAVKSGRWSVVGHVALDAELLSLPPKFIQDPIKKDQFRIYEQGGHIRPATREECLALERCSVWDPNHVEDRLRDHFSGRKNKWVESSKMRF